MGSPNRRLVTTIEASASAGFDTSYYTFNTNLGGTYLDETGQRQPWHPSKRGEPPPASLKGFKPFVDPIKLAWFKNPEFRIACSELTNRKRIIDSILFGQGAELFGPIPPANAEWYNPHIAQYPYNPESAKKRLEKIGFIDRNGDGLREDPEGHTIRFALLTNRENNIREKVGQILKDDFRAAGLDLQPEIQDFNTLTTKINATYDFDAYLLGFGPGVPPHPSMQSNILPSGSRLHYGYPNQKVPATDWEAEVDALYSKMKLTFDFAEQQKLFFRIQQVFTDNQPAVFLYSQKVNLAARNNVGGLRPAILRGSLTFNMHELYIKKQP
jgi:peptide/nickel transport system substrate-binding protein